MNNMESKYNSQEDFLEWLKTKDNYCLCVGFYNEIKDMIKSSNYALKDEKQFKNELASFLYRLTIDAKTLY